ncbi:MAG TPA: GNAT family N-acetyltransferase [Syntrophomonadaceae bacterium]|nr:GNAT family N-acetyltransferase [Syntrophomonadaceae bacterium]HQA08490.1 GNAT family N-acetyltransferase [Syntrophomonadaceae bacterium]HQE23642.1 GNAT family N-acetyltransferase [Syntrophomonadaceae bacterium]
MESITIELARQTDIPYMLELWQDTPGVGLGPGDDEISLTAFMQRNPTTCLVLKYQDSIIGTVLGGFDGRRGYIYHLVVHKDFRRQGYGKKLLQEAVKQLKALKADKIHLFVLKTNPEVEGFYEKQGWIKRKDIEIFSFNAKDKGEEE